MKHIAPFIVLLLWVDPSKAHGFSSISSLHNLIGPDHMLAIIAVGAWSAQMGGRTMWTAPLVFVLVITFGGILGMSGSPLPWSDTAITLSVLFLGGAILVGRPIAWPFAICVILIFGWVHGYALGVEFSQSDRSRTYIIGFLITTVGLHAVGLVGASLILDRRSGGLILGCLGGVVAIVGFDLFLQQI